MMRSLRQRETAHLAEMLSRQLNTIHVPHEPGSRISGICERAVMTPTGADRAVAGRARLH
jgi:hypothetical protein